MTRHRRFKQEADIFVIPFSKISNEIGNVFLSETLKNIPEAGIETPKYYMFNTNLTLHNPLNTQIVSNFNMLISRAAYKAPMLQILKNQ